MQSLSCRGFRLVFGQDLDRFWSKLVQRVLDYLQIRDLSLQIGRRLPLDGRKMVLRWSRIRLHDSMIGPKTTPRCSQGGSRGPQQGSKGAQDDPVWHQQDTKLGQHESQTWLNCITLRKNTSMKTIKILRGFASKLQPGEPRWSQCAASWHHMRASRQHWGTRWHQEGRMRVKMNQVEVQIGRVVCWGSKKIVKRKQRGCKDGVKRS